VFASIEGLGQAITAPSGQLVDLSPEEEREIVKQAASDRIKAGLMIGTDIRKASIDAVGTAIGMAVGGALIGMFLRKKS
jgi:hypothetical protein